jgi:hypothetical protein
MMVRCVVGVMARHSPRHRSCVLPTIASAATTAPRSLSVRRPERSPPRRSCILLAAASLLRLRTRHTALCYFPFNERSKKCNRGRWRGYGGLRAQRRPAGCSPDGAASARVRVLTMSSGRPGAIGSTGGLELRTASSGGAADHIVAMAGAIPWPFGHVASSELGGPRFVPNARLVK